MQHYPGRVGTALLGHRLLALSAAPMIRHHLPIDSLGAVLTCVSHRPFDLDDATWQIVLHL